MRLLLDTHIWIWLLESPDRIAVPVVEQLESADELVLSAASVWEIAIKTALGKLQMTVEPEALREEILGAAGARELDIMATHALAAARLPALHRDPFDRVLIAQAAIENLILVTRDEAVRQYGGGVLWAG